MVNENHLPVLFRTDDLYHTLEAEQDEEVKQILGIQTYYEQQWIARGLTIKYLKYQLPQQGELVEPNVEIELDDYRSYNRSKRSGLTTSKWFFLSWQVDELTGKFPLFKTNLLVNMSTCKLVTSSTTNIQIKCNYIPNS